MQFGTFVEVGIGLAMMYAMLALLCTTINELIATFSRMRSDNLKGAILHLVDNKQLYLSFYNHGIIRSEIEASVGKPLAEKAPDPTKLEAALDAQKHEKYSPKPEAGDMPGQHTSYLDSKTFALALIDSLDSTKPIKSVEEAIAIAEKLPQSNIRDVLLPALNDAGNDLQKARENVATWFDGAMDRLSGNYKRQIQKITLAIAFIIAAAINADSIAITRELWEHDNLRSGIADQATKLTPEILAQKCPPETAPADPAHALDKQLDCQVNYVKTRLDALKPLPLGWDLAKLRELGVADALLKIIGIILTALAISLGAPFWFDLMQKLVDIRGAGKKPTTQVEKDIANAAR